MFCQGLGESLPFLSFYKLLLIIRQVANPKKIPAPPGAGGNLDGICDIWLIIVNQGGRMGCYFIFNPSYNLPHHDSQDNVSHMSQIPSMSVFFEILQQEETILYGILTCYDDFEWVGSLLKVGR